MTLTLCPHNLFFVVSFAFSPLRCCVCMAVQYKDYFGIAVAGYPEGHISAKTLDEVRPMHSLNDVFPLC